MIVPLGSVNLMTSPSEAAIWFPVGLAATTWNTPCVLSATSETTRANVMALPPVRFETAMSWVEPEADESLNVTSTVSTAGEALETKSVLPTLMSRGSAPLSMNRFSPASTTPSLSPPFPASISASVSNTATLNRGSAPMLICPSPARATGVVGIKLATSRARIRSTRAAADVEMDRMRVTECVIGPHAGVGTGANAW